jgi:hypothetical protein
VRFPSMSPLLAVALGACAAAPPVGTEGEALTDGCEAIDFVSPAREAHTVWASGCFGEVIASRWLITSARCAPAVGDPVFYVGAEFQVVYSSRRLMTAVYYLPGVSVANDDYTDALGLYGDLAVVQVDTPFDTSPDHYARLAHLSSPSGNVGIQVGKVYPDSCSSEFSFPYWGEVWSTLRSNGSGSFILETHRNDDFDFGAGYYEAGVAQAHLVGLYSAYVFDWLELRDKYASVAPHLSWILSVIGYTPFYVIRDSSMISAVALESFVTGDQKVCAYACDTNVACKGWEYWYTGGLNTCILRPAAGPIVSGVSGVRAGSKITLNF